MANRGGESFDGERDDVTAQFGTPLDDRRDRASEPKDRDSPTESNQATGSKTVVEHGLPVAHLQRPATARPTTLAVVSDLHVTPHAHGTWKVFHRTEERLRTALFDSRRFDLDGVVVLGDLTKDGAPEEFGRTREVAATLDVPLLGVPGNHDVAKSGAANTPPLADFVTRYTPGTLPFRQRLGGVDVLGLNSASMPDGSLADTHDGAISTEQLAWLDGVLEDIDVPLITLHHNLTSPTAQMNELPETRAFQLRNASELAAVLDAHDVSTVLSGHLHWPTVGMTGDIREVIAPAACSFPQAYLLVHVGPRGTTVVMRQLTDRAGLAEAYRYLCRNRRRGQQAAEHLQKGYFGAFPLVDERTDARSSPPIPERSDASRSPGESGTSRDVLLLGEKRDR